MSLKDIIIVSLIFLLDRISKIYVIHQDKNFPGSEIFSSKFLNISLIWNEGIAFGLFSFDDTKLYNVLTLLILIIILVIVFMISKSVGLKKLALLMILGGALGNVLEVFEGDFPVVLLLVSGQKFKNKLRKYY